MIKKKLLIILEDFETDLENIINEEKRKPLSEKHNISLEEQKEFKSKISKIKELVSLTESLTLNASGTSCPRCGGTGRIASQ